MNQNLKLQIKSWCRSKNSNSFANFLTSKNNNFSIEKGDISFLENNADYIWDVIEKCNALIDRRHLTFGHRDAYNEKTKIISFFLDNDLIKVDSRLVDYIKSQITYNHPQNVLDKNELYGRARSGPNINLYRFILRKSNVEDWKSINNIGGFELFDIYDLDNVYFNILSKLDLKEVLDDNQWVSDIRNNIKDKLIFECKLINTRRLHFLPTLFEYKPLEIASLYISHTDKLTFQFWKLVNIDAIDAYLLNNLYNVNFELKNELNERDKSKINNLLFMYKDNLISKELLLDELKSFYSEHDKVKPIHLAYE